MHKAIAKLLRPKILFTCYIIVFLGSAASGEITYKTLLALAVLAAWYLHAASSNDYADRHIDAINLKDAKDRPLISKDVSYRQLWTIHAVAGVAALLLASVYGFISLIFMAVILALDYAYSFKPIRISSRGIVSQLMLPIAYVAYPLALGYWSVPAPEAFPWLLGIAVYLGFTARLFLKDFRDVQGDRKYGKQTFLLRHGVKTTCIASAAFGLASTVFVALAIDFSPGVLALLIIVQYFALKDLKQLAGTETVERQMPLIRRIAGSANLSVMTLLAYFLCAGQPGLSDFEVAVVPTIVGLLLLAAGILGRPKQKHDTIA